MTSQHLRIAILLLASLFSIARAVASDDTFQSQARAAFTEAIMQYDIPGLVVGVTHHGEHRFYAAGLASRAQNIAVGPGTLFEVGSISKLFTATLAALAEQQGQLSLDTKVAHYLCADVCSIGQDMTLMDLATHYSGGLPLQVPENIATTEALVNWLKAWRPPAPGMRSYSNISIGLLGHVTAHAMRMPYTQAMQTVLLPQLGLTSTWIDVPATEMNRYAYGYERNTNKPIRLSPGVLAAEAYGVKSSPRDILKFLDVVLGHGEAPAQVKAAIRRTQEGQLATTKFIQDMVWEQYPWPANLATMTSANGYDFILNPQKADRITPPLAPQKNVVLNKTGATNGFGAYVAVVPGENLGVVVLANRNFPNEARISAPYALINAVLGQATPAKRLSR